MNTLLIAIGIGILAGILSGLFGIGGGIVIVPLLIYVFSMTQQEAQGTTLAMLAIPVSLVAALNYYKQGMVDWKVAFLLALGFMIGGFFGSKLALSVSPVTMRKAFAVMMILVAIKMLWEKR